jgi:hypothetical protein
MFSVKKCFLMVRFTLVFCSEMPETGARTRTGSDGQMAESVQTETLRHFLTTCGGANRSLVVRQEKSAFCCNATNSPDFVHGCVNVGYAALHHSYP